MLDTRDVADGSVDECLSQIDMMGDDQYDTYVTDRLVDRTVPIHTPIKRNKLALFRSPTPKVAPKQKQQITSLKNDCSLFSRLFISCQVRDGNLDEFFSHENQANPPSLSDINGELHSCTKSDLLQCLGEDVVDLPVDVEAIIIDGAALVHKLQPDFSKQVVFEHYALQFFLPYIERLLQRDNCSRVDVVWDVYLDNSLKLSTRKKRGKGIRRRVEANNAIPRNSENFLRENKNKTELFSYLASVIANANIAEDKCVVSTQGQNVISNIPHDLTRMCPCTQEEADSRLLLHAADCVATGVSKLMVMTVDTDVVVLCVAYVQRLGLQELWVEIGTGKHQRYIAAHRVANELGEQKAVALPAFHAFSGCDTVSSFAGRSKKTTWDVWNAFPAVTPAFVALGDMPDSGEEHFDLLEQFVVLMYDRTSSEKHVNVARKVLFAKKGRAMNAIPPTRGALIEHTMRTAYQAGHVWGQALTKTPNLPSPDSWGWHKNVDHWEPFWTSLPDAAKVQAILKCGCKKGCTARCKCVKAELPCTSMCNCDGECRQ